MYRKIREFDANAWDTFISDHPDLYIAQACLENTPTGKFWSISEQFPDLVCCLHTQVRLMVRFGLNGGILWLRNTEGTLCFICQQENETLNHFLFVCTSFRRLFDSLWANLVSKINNSNPTDGAHMSHFIMNLSQHHKHFCYQGAFPLLFDISTMTVIPLLQRRLEKFIKYAPKRYVSWRLRASLNSTSYVFFFFSTWCILRFYCCS